MNLECFSCFNKNEHKISVPIENLETLYALKVKDKIYLEGEIFVFRDQVHKIIATDNRVVANINFSNSAVYYCAATAAKGGFVVGSCGPTSSYRMDDYTEAVLALGVKIMIGKGYRSSKVSELCRKYGAIYVITYGGCGALISNWIKSVELIAFPELGTEAMYKYSVENFEGIVAIDTYGNTLWKE